MPRRIVDQTSGSKQGRLLVVASRECVYSLVSEPHSSHLDLFYCAIFFLISQAGPASLSRTCVQAISSPSRCIYYHFSFVFPWSLLALRHFLRHLHPHYHHQQLSIPQAQVKHLLLPPQAQTQHVSPPQTPQHHPSRFRSTPRE